MGCRIYFDFKKMKFAHYLKYHVYFICMKYIIHLELTVYLFGVIRLFFHYMQARRSLLSFYCEILP